MTYQSEIRIPMRNLWLINMMGYEPLAADNKLKNAFEFDCIRIGIWNDQMTKE
jgi:hypothetical protein